MRTIQKIYANAYSNRQDQNFYIEIDCKHIAKKMKVDNELVFQRLYSHLEKNMDTQTQINLMFTFFLLPLEIKNTVSITHTYVLHFLI